jgi:hypothetical protein
MERISEGGAMGCKRMSRFAVQQLESWLPLAGDVMIVQQRDLFTITGDRAANGLEIEKNALGTLRIAGMSAGSPRTAPT